MCVFSSEIQNKSDETELLAFRYSIFHFLVIEIIIPVPSTVDWLVTYREEEEYMTHYAKSDLMGIAKSIDSGQPAQSVQFDHSRNFSSFGRFSIY